MKEATQKGTISMSDINNCVPAYDPDQCRQLLSSLPGVFAAGIRVEDDHFSEIHVLASTERSAKQIARDIQSALFACYGIDVDHRIISIAQLPLDPFQAPAADTASAEAPCEKHACSIPCEKDIRVQFSGIEASQKNGVFQANVQLVYGDTTFSGSAKNRDTASHRNRTVATATLEAVNTLLEREYFSLLDVKQLSVWDFSIVVTVVECLENDTDSPKFLVGAAIQPDNAYLGVVRSTLDALNRCISKLYHVQTNDN